MGHLGNKTYQHSFLIAKKEIEDGLSEKINFDNCIIFLTFLEIVVPRISRSGSVICEVNKCFNAMIT